ncbi:MAG: VWA domain-containing protein [Chloroflexota bacterium]
MSLEADNHYTILGVNRQATTEDIQTAFAKLRENELRQADNLDGSAFQQVNYAYEVLSDPKRRAIYDSLLGEIEEPVLDVKLIASRTQIPISETEQVFYLRIDIRPPQQDVPQLPLNLCLVIDRSTSMRGARLQKVQTAVELIIKQLGPDDLLSIVSFSDRAQVVVPSSSITNQQAILNKIRDIRASGGTEIFQGLREGVEQLKQIALPDYSNHLILLTDGHTYGDARHCLELAKDVAPQGINMTAFGIGSEWNDSFLDDLVAPSGGLSSFIETPAEIIDYLQSRISSLGKIYAQNVRLKQDFPNSLALRYGFKLTPFAQPLPLGASDDISLGDIEGRAPLSLLLELFVQPQGIPTRINIPLTVTADVPSQNIRQQTFTNRLQLFVLSDATEERPSDDILEAVRLLNLYRMNEKVWADVDDGQVAPAANRMRHLTTRLLEAGQTKLAQQAHLEAERLAKMGTLSSEGRKRLKYGTRALMTQTGRLNLG